MFERERTDKMKTPGMTDLLPCSRDDKAEVENEQLVPGTGSLLEHQEISRRTLLKGGSALAGLTVLRVAGPAHAFASEEGNDDSQPLGQPGEEVIPWLDQPPPNPIPDNVGNLLKWEELDSWRIPTEEFFFVNHFGQPGGLHEATWHVGISGLVARPQSLTLADIKARPRHEVDFTLECSGNNGTGLDFFIGGIGNARWAGTRLAPLLEVKAEAQKCGMSPTKFALEVIESFAATRRFWRTDLPVVEQQMDSVTETQAAVVKPGEPAA